MSAQLSEYERLRLERIKENQTFLQEIGIKEEQSKLEAASSKKKKARRATNVSRKRVKVEVPVEERRSSSRLKGEKAENIYVVGTKGSKVIVGRQPITMEIGGKPELETYDLNQARYGESKRMARNEEDTLTLETKSGKDFYADLLAENDDSRVIESSFKLSEWTCVKAFKAIPHRVYSLAFNEKVSDPLLCALGDKEGNLSIVRVPMNTDDVEDGEVMTYRPHVSTINCLHWSSNDLYSFSYDGTIRKVSLDHPEVFEKVFATSESLQNNSTWLQHGVFFNNDPNSMFAGLSDGQVLRISTKSGKPVMKLNAHEKKIQTVSISADDKYFATASLDRSVKVWDIRKTKKALCTFSDTHSINCAYFNPTGDKLVSVGQSNHIQLFSNPMNESGDLEPTHSISHDNRTGRYLSVFHNCWDPHNPDGFVVGSMAKNPRRVEYFCVTKQNKLKLAMNLTDELIASIQSRFAFHPKLNILACANASGRLHIIK